MGLMTFMRTKMGYFLVGGIAVVLALFVLEPLLQHGSAFFNASSRTTVGVIDGEEVRYDEFNPQVEQGVAQFKQQYGGAMNPQMQAMAVDQAWQAEVAKVVLNKEYERLGLTVSSDELYDLIQGSNPSPLIRQYFGDPKTGLVDRNAVITSLKTQDPNIKKQWALLENEIEKQALQQKYAKLISSSVFVTSLEAQDENTNRNKLASFKYVTLDYNSVADKDAEPTDADYQEYYNENKNRFQNNQETRSFDYVAFSVLPTAADSAATKAQVYKLAADFKTTTNDSLFAASNSDVKLPFTWMKKGQLEPAVDSALFNLPAGSYYGPAFSGSSYKLAKVVATKFSPDSVKASHILIDPAKVGGEDKAVKLADSLKALAVGGADFAKLAAQYSVDGSKDNGGDLGTFGRGAMVPAFENASFDGKPGDIKVVKSQFGVHVIKIVKQVGSSKVAKIAYIEKAMAPSQKTRDIAYKKASNFFNEVKDNASSFNEIAKKQGLTVAVADKITGTQGFAPGLEDPRKIIKAAFEADKGDVLPEIYTSDNASVVARLTAVRPKGQLALEDVKTDIKADVVKSVKAKKLIEKFEKAGSGSIEAIASKVGKQATPVANVVFANPVIPGIAQENKVIGTVFGLQPNKVSKAIEGDRGVYVVSLVGFSNGNNTADVKQQKQSLTQMLGQRSLGSAFQALQDKIEIKDNRVKFY